MMYVDAAAAVFDGIDELVASHSCAPDHLRLIRHGLMLAREKVQQAAVFLPIDVPMAVGAAVGTRDDDLLAAAAASTLVWAGADLMDDAADDELGPAWDGVPPAQRELVATTLLAVLPHLALRHVEAAEGRAGAAQEIATALWSMSEGQAMDLGGPPESIEQYLRMIERKTGTEVALFAALPAILGGAPAATVDAWREVGLRLGSTVQASTDVASAVTPPPLNDLLHGKASLPVFACRRRLAASEREAFDRDLSAAARGDHAALERAIARMVAARSIRESLAHVQLMLYRLSRTVELKLAGLAVDNPIFTMIRELCTI